MLVIVTIPRVESAYLLAYLVVLPLLHPLLLFQETSLLPILVP